MKPGAQWPIGITALLIGFAAVNIYAMRIAGSDPSFAVEPDYYKKAVAFDTTLAEERQSASLGWRATATLARHDTIGNVTVTLGDSTGATIDDARMTIRARFNARANEVDTATLSPVGKGRYTGSIVVRHAGEWEIDVDAHRGSDRFMSAIRVTAPPAK